jgi:lysophospholipase L1-like esterase
VGLAGAALEIPEGETFALRGAFGAFALHVLGPDGMEPRVAPTEPVVELPPDIEALALQERFRLQTGGGLLRIFQPAAPGPWSSLFLSLPPGLRLLGADLRSGQNGVLVDELGLNGAELFDLEKWDPVLRRALLAELRPALLVLAYGTNDVGRKDLEGPAYRERAANLLRVLRSESGAPILVVGPLDRMGRRRRGQNFRAGSRTVIEAMRRACADADCAFWDAKAAMGGDGAIQRWRKKRLAQRDLVHLTMPGYQKLGDLLLKALEDARKAGRG